MTVLFLSQFQSQSRTTGELKFEAKEEQCDGLREYCEPFCFASSFRLRLLIRKTTFAIAQSMDSDSTCALTQSCSHSAAKLKLVDAAAAATAVTGPGDFGLAATTVLLSLVRFTFGPIPIVRRRRRLHQTGKLVCLTNVTQENSNDDVQQQQQQRRRRQWRLGRCLCVSVCVRLCVCKPTERMRNIATQLLYCQARRVYLASAAFVKTKAAAAGA